MFTIQIKDRQLDLTYEHYVCALEDEDDQRAHKDIYEILRTFILDIIEAFSQETVEKQTLELAKYLYEHALNQTYGKSNAGLVLILSTFAVRFAFEHLEHNEKVSSN
jgi:hypothetical protein